MALAAQNIAPAASRGARVRRDSQNLAALQRARLLGAAVAVVEEDGLSRLTVASILSHARMSRKTFYEHFSDSEHCFLAAYEEALARARGVAAQAYAEEDDSRAGMRSAVRAVLELIDQERGLARVCVLDAQAGGELVLERHNELMDELAAAIDIGRTCAAVRSQPPPLSALAVAGGVLAVVQTHLRGESARPAGELTGAIMSIIVLPYLGRAAALQEIDTASRATRTPTPRAHGRLDHRLLADMNLRLTYRTIRVLGAIREHPGASNQRIADAAGIIDAGQISKLLKRLAGLGLIENTAAGEPNGSSNAWHLTAARRPGAACGARQLSHTARPRPGEGRVRRRTSRQKDSTYPRSLPIGAR